MDYTILGLPVTLEAIDAMFVTSMFMFVMVLFLCHPSFDTN